MLGLGALLDRYPRQLSGGQRQRVAIGRAIVRDARLFLFDEPLSNLDAQLRDEMRSELKRLHSELGKTFMYVTHDQIEAMTLADRIVVLKDGRVEQQGSPLDLFERPQTRFVAGFIGSPQMNFIALPNCRRRRPAAGRVAGRPRAPIAARPGAGCAPFEPRRRNARHPADGDCGRGNRAAPGRARPRSRTSTSIQPTGARSFISFRARRLEP